MLIRANPMKSRTPLGECCVRVATDRPVGGWRRRENSFEFEPERPGGRPLGPLPADAAEPPLRGNRPRAVPRGQRARATAPVDRPRGRRRRRFCPLRETDVIVSTHRGHHHCLAKGARPDRMMAELLGRADGYSRGRGGSMHVAIPEIGLLGTNGIVGGGIPIGTGAALGLQIDGRDDVAICFFGEGAAANGVFSEALNTASLWKLPIVFICENNRYVELTPQSVHVAGHDLEARRGLRHARPRGRRQRRRRDDRRGRGRRRPRPRGRRPDPDRGRDLPLVRPLRRRQSRLPRRGRGRDRPRRRPAGAGPAPSSDPADADAADAAVEAGDRRPRSSSPWPARPPARRSSSSATTQRRSRA